ncbi:SelT/SelW/SelH family protein [Nocardioides sp. YIM 152588]|uniref:SelT/SelW/SelH family protein n=1 Tax=Nocardioides sp. YIM 152588 TaxID=3158259 RepID=UPI0032E41A2F
MSEATPTAPGTGPVVTIRYCVDCKWLLRAQWYAGELLQTFSAELGGVLLVPAHGAMFRIDVDAPAGDDAAIGATTVWNRKTDGGFPEIADLKRRVRDLVAPGRALGHVDAKG